MSPDGRWALSGGQDGELRLWDLAGGACARTLGAHDGAVRSVALSLDGRLAVSGSEDLTLRAWALDWELEAREPVDWDEGARPWLEAFLVLHTPYAAALPDHRMPEPEEVTRALTRAGRPSWSAEDFERFLHTLGCAGYGWLRPAGVASELQRMATGWSPPASLSSN